MMVFGRPVAVPPERGQPPIRWRCIRSWKTYIQGSEPNGDQIQTHVQTKALTKNDQSQSCGGEVRSNTFQQIRSDDWKKPSQIQE
jgi:hypothetical protein